MTNAYKVSIIIPIYNAEKYLVRCFESIRHQTYSNLEVVLVDDGSTDNSGSICENYSKLDARIKVIHKKNGGPGEARNTGLDNCTGDYIGFIDADDFVGSDYIKFLLNICEENNCDLAQCSYLKGKSDIFPQSKKKERLIILDNIQIFENRTLKIGIWAKLFKSKLFDGIRFPVGKKYEDDFTTWKLAYKAKRITVTNKKLYYYYQSPWSVMRNKSNFINVDFYEAYNERMNFFKCTGETLLYEKSVELFCINLMFIYFECKKNRNNMNDKSEMINIYKQHYAEIIHFKSVKRSDKFIFILFWLFPDAVAGAVNLLKIRG